MAQTYPAQCNQITHQYAPSYASASVFLQEDCLFQEGQPGLQVSPCAHKAFAATTSKVAVENVVREWQGHSLIAQLAFKTAPKKVEKLKKSTWKLSVELTHPAEDGSFDSGNSEEFLQENVTMNGKTGNPGKAVHTEHFKSKVTAVSDKQFSKRHLTYLTEKFHEKNNLCDWLGVAASDKETSKLHYLQISQDKDGSDSEDQMKPSHKGMLMGCFIC